MSSRKTGGMVPRGLKVRLTVHVKPRASRSRILRCEGLELVVSLAAPPVDGAANAELLQLLASALGLRKSALLLVGGQTSKHKVVEVSDLAAAEVQRRLSEVPASEA